jgi:hypothetical protein
MYTYSLTIPAGTSKADAEEERVQLSAGILSRVLVFFPPGCCNRVHAIIFYQGYQIEPWNRDGSFHWNDYAYDIECEHEIIAPDTEVTIKAWNDDDIYEHTLDFAFDVVQPEEVTTEGLLQRLLKALTGEA